MKDKVGDFDPDASKAVKESMLAGQVEATKVVEDGVVQCHLPDFTILKDKIDEEYTFVPTCPPGYEQDGSTCEKQCNCEVPPSPKSDWYTYSKCNHGGGHACKIQMVCDPKKYTLSRANPQTGKLE